MSSDDTRVESVFNPLAARGDLQTVRRWVRGLSFDGRWIHQPDRLGAALLVMFFLSRGLDVRSAIWEAETVLVEEDGSVTGPVRGLLD